MNFVWRDTRNDPSGHGSNARATITSRPRRAPANHVVDVTVAGYDPIGSPFFVFFYPATDDNTYLPPHDHRDDFNGGLAVSTYHPRTAVPQHQYVL